MALGDTNISIGLVQSTISIGSTSNLGALIAMAKVNGTGSIKIGEYYDDEDNLVEIYSPMAFYVYETRGVNGNRYDGVLISGAKPYWNMYSNKIPAEWFNDAGAGNVLNLRLKRNPDNVNGGYDFKLGYFRGYELSQTVHPKPNLWITDLEVWEGATAEVTARFFSNFIDLSVANRSGGALTHYLLVFTRNNNNYASDIFPLDNSGSGVPTHIFTPAENTNLFITVYLLPNNIDTARVLMPIDFYTVNDIEATESKVTVKIKYYPVVGVDTMAIYQYPVDINLVLNETWDWESNPGTQGTALITDSSGNILPTIKVNNNGINNIFNQAMYIRFWGNVSGNRTFILYRNGVQLGNTQYRDVFSATDSLGYGINVNFGATGFDIEENDVFEIIVT